MFKHAQVGLDFSPATQPLQDCLQDLMPLGTTELTLAYVIDASYPGGSAIAHQEHYEHSIPGERQPSDCASLSRSGSAHPCRELLAWLHNRCSTTFPESRCSSRPAP